MRIRSYHIKKPVRLFGLMIVGAIVLFLLLNVVFPLPDNVEYSTIVTDDRDAVINAYLTRDEKWRMKTELEEISPLLRKTIVAKEDRYFYYHPGVNVLAIGRAMVKNLVRIKRTSGASTITMQVARMLEPRKRTLPAKFLEMFRALQLEWKYSKNEILQLYLNLVPYGGNIEGVKAASLLYFKKNPDHLSLSEITALSIIPNRPSSLVMGQNNEVIVQERNRWLHQFAKEKVFTPKEIEDALAEPLSANRGMVPHYVPHLSYKLKKEANRYLIKTNIHLNTQLKVEKLVEDYVRSLRLNNIRNAAVVIIDNKTHKVITYVGSGSFADTIDGGQVNGAAAIRQPGSTLKPLLYGVCIDEGLLTPKTIINDVPINYSGYAPENYDQKFNGYVSVAYALEHSLNIPSVKCLQLLGKEQLVNQLAALDFKQVKKDRNKLGLSMILGGCGTTLEELTGLFSAFANEGVYERPEYVRGNTGANLDRGRKRVEVLSKAASYMISDILSQVNRPDFPLNWQATERMPKIAWKTGTSYGRRDAWSIGYNKHFTVGIWVGNFSAQGVPELSGANTATPLLFKIFNTIDYDSDAGWFAPPEDCALRQVCSVSGLPPSPYCTNLILDYFIPLVSSTATCQHMQEVKVSVDSSISFCNDCAPASGYIKKLYPLIAPEMQDFYEANSIAYQKIPPHNPECEKIFRGDAPVITSPLNGNEYFISKQDPEPLQLSATAGNDVTKLYWYINDRFYKATGVHEKQFFIPTEGAVKISCTDDKGRNRNVRISVRYVNM
ncbi:penicillin-binding protein 1C [Chitinophagaceae bacterium LB-8]|uniref:peptidoglycan glycosyltransferase n=1 Tax=Paraflavisolibacter caeni TaxID=2982496 RepID=A0A9X2XU30_9BACT|nr:penicillin-binding protein 1C [Paraflavisolibacter caeni]MCU7548372.1 penicillin-binding protein 1C [Paraflavisolibacter caeni]